MLIQKSYINKLLNDSVQFSHWIDHLTLNLKDKIGKLHYILSVLDLDNSNQYYEDLNWYKLNYSKAISKNWLYLMVTISIKGIPHTIFNYLEYPDNKKDMFKSEWSFTFYSTYFRLCERWDLDLSFEKVFFWNFYRIVKHFPITRVDYRLDFFFKGDYKFPDKDDITKTRKDTKFTIYTLDKLKNEKNIIINKIHIKNNKLTGRDLWAKSNKSIFLRMYDKKIDSVVKKKVPLYDDYFEYGNVYRLEGEFRTKFLKKPNNPSFQTLISDLLKYEKNIKDTPRNYNYWELSEVEEKCMNYFCLIGNINKKFTYQYKENPNKDLIDYIYYKDFTGRWCKIALSWWNPFSILLKHFVEIETIREKISWELLDNLMLDFEQTKQKLIADKKIFTSVKKWNGINTVENERGTIGNSI